ncbi:MAG: bifunctional 5,10-methylenetetrahydrofolate dehydrogenase/5,10-methenyltetrahydrofolate cyclohydrolase [Candidatus Altimarinota bacterium]
MELLDGKKVSMELFSELKPRVNSLKERGISPKLVFFLVGENPASVAYVNMKHKACEEVGIVSEILRYGDDVSQETILNKMEELNKDPSVHGLMIQLPLPSQLSVPLVTRAIDPKKDADGFHAYNFGKMALAKEYEDLPPATALGIIRLLDAYNVKVEGMDIVVIGRSNLVGKPAAIMLMNRGATVTVCHSKTKDVADYCRKADMIIAATGVPKLVQGDWVKEGAIVVDAGFAKVDGKVTGDVDFDAVAPKCSWITPVPGGCGPMTIYAIVENTVHAAERITET